MSSPLAIAAVTAVLKDLLNNGLIDHDLASTVGGVRVTAQAQPSDCHRSLPQEGQRVAEFPVNVRASTCTPRSSAALIGCRPGTRPCSRD